MPELPVLLAALVVVAMSASLRGITGFGYNILLVPLLALFFDPKVVVPTVILHNFVLNLIMLAATWRAVDLRRIWLLVASGLVGTPLGVFLLGIVDADPLRLTIGAVVVLTGAALFAGLRWPIADERLASVLAGFAGGILNGMVGMAGPPVILLFANQGMHPTQFRANIGGYFTIVTAVAVAGFWLGGSITSEVTSLTVVTLPAAAIGLLIGMALHERVPSSQFYRLSLGVVMLAGAIAVLDGVLSAVRG
jgi:uncharacterized membrane protein YfcA